LDKSHQATQHLYYEEQKHFKTIPKKNNHGLSKNPRSLV